MVDLGPRANPDALCQCANKDAAIQTIAVMNREGAGTFGDDTRMTTNRILSITPLIVAGFFNTGSFDWETPI